MKFFHQLVLMLLLASAALADAPAPYDFAFGYILEPAGFEPICKITISEAMYRKVCRSDYGDLRIFNGQGEAVPHKLRKAVLSGVMKKQGAPPSALPFFPIYDTGETPEGATQIHVATNEKGVVVDVKSGAADPAHDSRVSAYLIDASALKTACSALDIAWSGNETSFTISVDIEASPDLNQWRTIARSATLAEMDFAGQRLSRHRIELSADSGKYMRLSWPHRARGARVVSVKALFPDELTVNQHVRQWTDVPGRLVREQNAISYEYDTGGKFPIDAIQLRLPETNSLLKARVKSRHEEQAPWREAAAGCLFYNLMIEGAALENTPLGVSSTTSRYWRIEAGKENGIGSGMPVLRIGWIPVEVLFVNRGQGPFTLAYGSANVQPSEQPLDALLTALNKQNENSFIVEARIRQPVVLGGEARLKPGAPPLPWKKWILWATLVAGVAVLGFMAWRLFSQMNAPGNRQS